MIDHLLNAAVQAPEYEGFLLNFKLDRGEYLCVDCEEVIENPICAECLFKELLGWLLQYPKLKKKVAPLLENFINSHENFDGHSQRCIVCGNYRDYMCPRCFKEFVLELLREKGVKDIVLKEYWEFFREI
jgi:hypothetical protein